MNWQMKLLDRLQGHVLTNMNDSTRGSYNWANKRITTNTFSISALYQQIEFHKGGWEDVKKYCEDHGILFKEPPKPRPPKGNNAKIAVLEQLIKSLMAENAELKKQLDDVKSAMNTNSQQSSSFDEWGNPRRYEW